LGSPLKERKKLREEVALLEEALQQQKMEYEQAHLDEVHVLVTLSACTCMSVRAGTSRRGSFNHDGFNNPNPEVT